MTNVSFEFPSNYRSFLCLSTWCVTVWPLSAKGMTDVISAQEFSESLDLFMLQVKSEIWQRKCDAVCILHWLAIVTYFILKYNSYTMIVTL